MKHKIKRFFLNLAIKYIVWSGKNSPYVSRAKEEFRIAWSNETDEMQEWMCKDVIELLSLLSTQGDSGFSIGYKLNLFEKMARFKTIAPLTFEDDEFFEPHSEDGCRQNKRNSGVFMYKDGRFRFVDDFICREKYYVGENNVVKNSDAGSYCGGVFAIREDGTIYNVRRGFIKDVKKFNPEPIYINVYAIEYPKDWWIKVCKESEFDKYFKNYDIEENFGIIEKELNYKDGKYRDEIISRIECAGKHMYGESFKLSLCDK